LVVVGRGFVLFPQRELLVGGCGLVLGIAWTAGLGAATAPPRDTFAVERLGALGRGSARRVGCAARALEVGFVVSFLCGGDPNNAGTIRTADALSMRILAIVLRDFISGLLEESQLRIETPSGS
jgi:hypothetical protein